MLPEKPLLMIMDGHALVRRAWHGMREPLNVRATGEEVTAVFGFLNTFLKAINDWKPTHCVITFDVSAPTFRHKQYAEYKAHRPPTPPELRSQFVRVRQLMESFKVPIKEMEGFEADDVMGTLVRQAEEQKIETLILTGDSDILQLVTPWVRVLLSYGVRNQDVYDEAAVKERYGGLGPEVVADIKALQGDTSDNIPGVPKIGAKSAIRLLTAYGTVENLYEHLDEVTPAGAQKTLRENKDLAFMSKELTTIRRDVPLDLDLEMSRFWDFDRPEIVELLRELEFHSFVARIPTQDEDVEQLTMEVEPSIEKLPTDYTIVDTEEALADMVSSLTEGRQFSFDTETTSINAMTAELVGFSFSNEPGKGWYVPVGHDEGKQLPMDTVLASLKPLLESDDIAKAATRAPC